jgi:SAM-dependent methyltransferase
MPAREERSFAIKGFANGSRYQNARPGYPAAAVAYLAERLDLRESRSVVDVGAGTGLFTRAITPYCSALIAVEPSEGMRREFESQGLGVKILDGTAESLPFSDHSVDVITVAQAFHWFDPAKALAEFNRVLVPGGRVGLIWNERDESVGWIDEMSRAMQWYEKQPYEVGMDFSPVLAEGGLVNIASRRFAHTQSIDRAGLFQRVLTTSYIAVMDEDEQQRILDAVAEVVSDMDEPIELAYVTTTYCARTPIL